MKLDRPLSPPLVGHRRLARLNLARPQRGAAQPPHDHRDGGRRDQVAPEVEGKDERTLGQQDVERWNGVEHQTILSVADAPVEHTRRIPAPQW